MKRRKASSVGHILRRNCLLRPIIEGNADRGVEVTGRRVKRRKQLLDDLKETRVYWGLKDKALASDLCRTLGRGYGPVVRQTTE